MEAWAFTKQTFGTGGITLKVPPRTITLHSTETTGWPGYNDGKNAPHVTVHPRKRETRQHIPFNLGGRALVAPSGFSTNSWGTIQVEIIGYCSNRGPNSILTFDEDDLTYLAQILKRISEATGVPLTTDVVWGEDYPNTYGNWRGRLSANQWLNYRGVLGHMHVAGNSHGDPGSLNVARILQLATGSNIPAEPTEPTEELDMALRLGKIVGSPEVFVGDGISRRHVPDSDTLDKIQAAIRAGQYKGDATIVDADDLDWLGVDIEDIEVEVTVPPVEIDYDLLADKVAERVGPGLGAAVLDALAARLRN